MKKVLIGFSIFLSLWAVVACLYSLGTYVTLKYQVEEIDQVAVVEKVYAVVDGYVVLQTILFVGCLVLCAIWLVLSHRRSG